MESLPNHGGFHGVGFEKLSPEELLAAESAVLTQRSLMEAMRTAPHGRGMAHLEAVVLNDGYEHLRKMMGAAAASHEGAHAVDPQVIGNAVLRKDGKPGADCRTPRPGRCCTPRVEEAEARSPAPKIWSRPPDP